MPRLADPVDHVAPEPATSSGWADDRQAMAGIVEYELRSQWDREPGDPQPISSVTTVVQPGDATTPCMVHSTVTRAAWDDSDNPFTVQITRSAHRPGVAHVASGDGQGLVLDVEDHPLGAIGEVWLPVDACDLHADLGRTLAVEDGQVVHDTARMEAAQRHDVARQLHAMTGESGGWTTPWGLDHALEMATPLGGSLRDRVERAEHVLDERGRLVDATVWVGPDELRAVELDPAALELQVEYRTRTTVDLDPGLLDGQLEATLQDWSDPLQDQ